MYPSYNRELTSSQQILSKFRLLKTDPHILTMWEKQQLMGCKTEEFMDSYKDVFFLPEPGYVAETEDFGAS